MNANVFLNFLLGMFSTYKVKQIFFKLKQNSHTWIRVINFPKQQEREKRLEWMDSRVGKDPVRMSLNNRYLFAFNFHHVHSLLLVLLAHVLNKIPTDPYGNYGCHASLVITTPCLCNWSGNQVFLSFHSNSLVPTPETGDNQKWSPQADLLAFPHPDREHRKNVYFLKFLL